jgi:hypothetical protein
MENVLLHILGIRMQLFLAILHNMEVAHKVCYPRKGSSYSISKCEKGKHEEDAKQLQNTLYKQI